MSLLSPEKSVSLRRCGEVGCADSASGAWPRASDLLAVREDLRRAGNLHVDGGTGRVESASPSGVASLALGFGPKSPTCETVQTAKRRNGVLKVDKA